MEDVPFPSSADGYVLVELIGKGMFNNEVWKATVPTRQNEEVAIKIIDLEEYSQDNLESIRVRTFSFLLFPALSACIESRILVLLGLARLPISSTVTDMPLCPFLERSTNNESKSS